MLANSIHSEARLRFSWGEAEAKTKLIERSLGGLCHLSKGYWDGGMVMLQLVNPTAGMFAGDSLELSIELDDRAQVAITSPSATRFHTMEEAESARLSQYITIGDKAFLEYWPEMVIPQRGSSTVQETVLQIHGGGSVLFFDAVAPGRVAHNEVNAYRSYLNSIDVYVGGALKARERLKLEPKCGSWGKLVPDWDACYLATLWVYSASSISSEVEVSGLVSALEEELGGLCAFSDLGEGLGVFRLLAPDAIIFQKLSKGLRSIVYDSLAAHQTNFRKI